MSRIKPPDGVVKWTSRTTPKWIAIPGYNYDIWDMSKLARGLTGFKVPSMPKNWNLYVC